MDRGTMCKELGLSRTGSSSHGSKDRDTICKDLGRRALDLRGLDCRGPSWEIRQRSAEILRSRKRLPSKEVRLQESDSALEIQDIEWVKKAIAGIEIVCEGT